MMPNFLIRFITDRLFDVHVTPWKCVMASVFAHYIIGLGLLITALCIDESTCSIYVNSLGVLCVIAGTILWCIKSSMYTLWTSWSKKYECHPSYRYAVMSYIDSSGNIWVEKPNE